MVKNYIPSGYSKTDEEGFRDFDEVIRFFQEYCFSCEKREKKRVCKLNQSLRRSSLNEEIFWDKSFKRVESREWRDSKVVCMQFQDRYA